MENKKALMTEVEEVKEVKGVKGQYRIAPEKRCFSISLTPEVPITPFNSLHFIPPHKCCCPLTP